jgi:hypothetical protein
MPSEKVIKLSHTVLFTLSLLSSIVALAISASLVSHYNNEGYPPVHTGAYRDRIRICLVAAVWSTAATSKWAIPLSALTRRRGCAGNAKSRIVLIAVLLIVGFQVAGRHRLFGVLSHLVLLAIGFILFIIGAASLTALTRPIDCGRAGDTFARCNIVKGLVIISWIDT